MGINKERKAIKKEENEGDFEREEGRRDGRSGDEIEREGEAGVRGEG